MLKACTESEGPASACAPQQSDQGILYSNAYWYMKTVFRMRRRAVQACPAGISQLAFLYVRVADGPITARYRFIKNAYWAVHVVLI